MPDKTSPTTGLSLCSLNIGIVGAGIAGLSCAIALAKSGHRVEIFEKSNFANEIGAAINVCPNASRILHRWGFDFVTWPPYEAERVHVFDEDSLKIVADHSYKELEQLYGSKYYLYHRVDLHTGLKELALREKAYRHPVNLRLGCKVESLDCDKGIIRLGHDTQIVKDLIVVATGIKSRFTNDVTGATAKAVATGMNAFRWLAPKKDLEGTVMTKRFLEKSVPGINVATGKNHTRLVWYPCRGGDVVNFVGLHPEKGGRNVEEDWGTEGQKKDLIDTFKGFDETIVAVCKKADGIKLWPLYFRAPLESWYRGRAVLVGDACHPMLPHQGQGGAQAIEDGAALGILFACAKQSDDVDRLLDLFQGVRRNRASAIQHLSNAGQDEAKSVVRKVQPYVDGKVPETYQEIHDFNFGHDVMLECEKALKARGFSGGAS